MKSLIHISILSVTLIVPLISQSTDSSARIRESKRQQSFFVDQDGVPDTPPGKGKKQMKRDQFVDKNGDGICDSREQGLGFQRMRTQSEQTGKQIRRGKK